MAVRVDLRKPPTVPQGLLKTSVAFPQCDLAQEVRRLLVLKGITKTEVDLSELHLHVPKQMQVSDEFGLNQITKAFYETSEAYERAYHNIICQLANSIFRQEFLFQATPTVRFHFPIRFHEQFRTADGKYLGHHADSLVGHSLEEINCWMPLTNCFGTAALQIAPLDTSVDVLEKFAREIDFDAEQFFGGRERFASKLISDGGFRADVLSMTKPMDMKYGDLLIFDGRCIHATAENSESITRVSIDFRVIPLAVYERLDRVYVSQGRSKRRFTRGDIFASQSSIDLLQHAQTL